MRHLSSKGVIVYNAELTSFARKNRKDPTKAEEKLWTELLKERKMKGYKFLRQKPVHRYILDFYCSKLLMGIEVDGQSHLNKKDYDDYRTYVVKGLGLKILRFKNEDIMDRIDDVSSEILKEVNKREKGFKSRLVLSLSRERMAEGQVRVGFTRADTKTGDERLT